MLGCDTIDLARVSEVLEDLVQAEDPSFGGLVSRLADERVVWVDRSSPISTTRYRQPPDRQPSPGELRRFWYPFGTTSQPPTGGYADGF